LIAGNLNLILSEAPNVISTVIFCNHVEAIEHFAKLLPIIDIKTIKTTFVGQNFSILFAGA
jgi:hypothetical protein